MLAGIIERNRFISPISESEKIILNSAIKLFLENGYSNTTLKMISEDCKMAQGTITYHFHTKEDMLYILIQALMDFHSDIIDGIYSDVKDDLNGGTGASGVDYSEKEVADGTLITVNAAPRKSGYSFRPDKMITRAESMTLINRVLNRIPENTNDLLDAMTKWPDNADTSVWYYIAVQEATNSHEFKLKNNHYETWIELKENRNWLAYED